MEANEGNSLDKKYYEQQISESCLHQISISDTPKLSSLNAITDVGKWMACFSSLKSLSHQISGRDSRKGGGL